MFPKPRRQGRAWKTLLLQLGLLGSISVSAWAQGSPPAIPDELKNWVPWVLDGHPDLGCPLVAGERICWWPGRLLLALEDQGGRFEIQVVADRDLEMLLPGDAKAFPQQVEIDGRPALLRRRGDLPWLALPRGEHRVTGQYRWLRLPESLPIPPEMALVDLRLGGRAVTHPHREANGLLWLAAREAEGNAEDGLDLEVFRRIADGVPVVLETQLRLRVSGQAREIALPEPLLEGFEPVELVSDLPARFGPDRVLRVQLRPGEWQVRLTARSRGDVTSLSSVARPEPWPAEELWVFAADPAIRAVRVDGAPGIDPQRTTLPEDWKSLPAFQVTAGVGLEFGVLRRGEPQPPPDQIEVRRQIWLASAGDRWTVRDALSGTLNQGGRLEAMAPAQLGRVALALDGERRDQVITRSPTPGGGEALAGVEVRSGQIDLEADALYPRNGALPAVGWNRDASSLSVQLSLPPGWSLLAARGADSTHGAWVDGWNLLDFFLLLIVVLSIAKLDGWKMACLALGVLVLAWQEEYALAMVWTLLAILLLRGLEQLRPPGAWRRFLRGALTLTLLAMLVLFVRWQWRTGRFPQLDQPYGSQSFEGMGDFQFGLANQAVPEAAAPSAPARQSYDALSKSLEDADEVEEAYQQNAPVMKRARQVDPNAVVQTGPGVPTWRWRTLTLSWQGPVKQDHPLHLLLISPGQELILAILRIVGFLALVALTVVASLPGARLGPFARKNVEDDADEKAPEGTDWGPTASSARVGLLPLLALFLWTGLTLGSLPAWADSPPLPSPSPASADILGELEKRLTRPPQCAPDCVELARLELSAEGNTVRWVAEAHAAAETALSLPGPFSAFAPSEVLVDGRPTAALRLMPDGFLALRLTPGVHRVEVRAPARDSLSLQFPLPPRVLTWKGVGFTLDGWHEDEAPPSLVRIDRTLPQEAAENAAAGAELPPWLELSRRLDIGMPWLIHYELRRLGPADGAVLLRVPLLAGESVTSAGVPVEAGLAQISLQPGETSREWTSTLSERDELELFSPQDRPWLERWELLCSPIWHCTSEGLTPIRHMNEGEWRPEWRPWPGESLRLRFVRPTGAPGQTMTIDRAALALEPGRRLLEGTLTLAQRASRGGEQTLGLPAEAELLSFSIDGNAIPVQNVGGKVVYTVEPGAHEVVAHWRQDFSAQIWQRAPAVTLPAEAANADITVQLPQHRWLLATGGPDWGPVVLFWQDVVALALLAFALGRWVKTPLRMHDWFLLGLGLTQTPAVAAGIVILFLGLLGWRWRPSSAWRHDLWQLGLIFLGIIALFTLYASIHSGLLLDPDMQISGAGSSRNQLHWYAERVSGAMPQPWLIWLPIFAYRLFMLLWALWLASRCLRWLPWCWQQFQISGQFFALPRAWRERQARRGVAPPAGPAGS